MASNDVYCEYCGGKPPYNYPCRCSWTGSHVWHQRGEVSYRVRAKRDGYVYRVDSPLHLEKPDKYELVEKITW